MTRREPVERRSVRPARVAGALIVVVSAVALVILLLALVQRDRAESSAARAEGEQYSAPAVTTPASRIVSVITDEFWDLTDADRPSTWPVLLGDDLHAQVFVQNPGGAYTKSFADDGATFVNAAGQVAPRASAVVVLGGQADLQASPTRVQDAAESVYAAATATAPYAKLVVIGPVVVGPDAAARSSSLRSALRAAVKRTHGTFVDPVAEGWFVPSDGSFTRSGGLTDAGQRRMAGYLVGALSDVLR